MGTPSHIQFKITSPCVGISNEINGGTIFIDKAKILEIKPQFDLEDCLEIII